jgi:hypothetical protein
MGMTDVIQVAHYRRADESGRSGDNDGFIGL